MGNDVAWGKHMWYTIHYVALGYPENPTHEDVNTYYSFYRDLYKVIPCPNCREHYKENFGKLDINRYLISRKSLFEWTVQFVNLWTHNRDGWGKSEVETDNHDPGVSKAFTI